MFEKASKMKLRFQSSKGLLMVEDLWDLSLEELDSIFKTLNSKLKVAQQESLLDTKSKEDKKVDLQIEIIKFIVEAKKKEKSEKLSAVKRKEERQKLLELAARKRDASLEVLTLEEIQKKLDAIDAEEETEE